MALAAEEYAQLAQEMGVAGTAAANLDDILNRLAASQRADVAAARAAEAAGVSVTQMRNAMAAATNAAADAEKKLAAAQKDAAASAKKASEAAKAQKDAQANADTQRNAFSDLTASGDSLNETLAALNEEFGMAAQGLAVMGALAAAAAAGLGKLMQMAVVATQAKDAMRGMLGADTVEMLEEMSKSLPFTTDQLGAWAKGLQIAGYEGDRLKTALEAVAASAARMKDGGAAAQSLLERLKMMADIGGKVTFDRRMLKGLKEAGLGIEDIAKALGVSVMKMRTMSITADQLGDAVQRALITKGAGALARMGQTWDAIKAKVSEGFGDAFEDLGDLVGPFMKEVQALFGEFYKGSATSKGLAGVVRGILTPAFHLATSAVRSIHIAFLYVEIYALKAMIALRPLTDWLKRIGATSFAASWGLTALKWIAVGLAIILGVLAVAAFLVVLPFLLVIAAVFAVVFGLYKLGSAIAGAVGSIKAGGASILSTVADTVGGVATYLANLPIEAAKAGGNFVLGLIQAILTGQGPVADAVKALARSAINAITGIFVTKSPSQVTKKIGGHFAAGLAGGIDEGSEDVEGAAAGSADAAVGGLKKGMRKGKAGGATRIVRIESINFYGSAGDFPSFREQADAWLEELDAGDAEPEAT